MTAPPIAPPEVAYEVRIGFHVIETHEQPEDALTAMTALMARYPDDHVSILGTYPAQTARLLAAEGRINHETFLAGDRAREDDVDATVMRAREAREAVQAEREAGKWWR